MEEIYLNAINNINDGVYFVNNERKILFWNHAAERITGYTAEEIVGKNCQHTMLNHIDEDGRPLCIIGCPLFATLKDGKQRQGRVFVRHKNGYRVPIKVNIFPMIKDDKIIGATEIFTPDSPKVYDDDLVEKLSYVAMHDQLTRLPNRRYLESFLNYKIDEYQRFGLKFAVLFADIDDFRIFNNNYGHDLGDTVLKNIAESIRRNVHKNDLVGRWGGEEFVGIYCISDNTDIASIGESFRQLIINTDVNDGKENHNVTVSVGITEILPEDTALSVVKRADTLMYQSKREGKNKVSSDK